MNVPRFSTALAGALCLAAAASPSAARAAEPAEPESAESAETPPAPLAGYDRGFFIRSEDGLFRLQINARFEARFSYLDVDDAEAQYQFSVPRSRLALGGHAFSPALRYRFQAAFDSGQPSLKDFYADYAFIPGWLELRLGQDKRPLSRAAIISSPDFQFNERAITNLGMGGSRDIGVMVHNGYRSSPPFEYAVGVYNDTGEAPWLSGRVVVDPSTGEGQIQSGGLGNVPEHFRPGLVARLGYNHGGIQGYTGVDREGGPPRFAVAGSAHLSFCAAACGDAATAVVRLDHMVKAYGATVTAGEVLGYEQAGESFSDQRYALSGFHLQAGYLIVDLLHPALRYGRLHSREEGARHEAGAALSVFFFEERLAWRTDALHYWSPELYGRPTDWVFRTQLQAVF